MTKILTTREQKQLLSAPVRRIMQILGTAGEARIVGGAVRDVVLNRILGDIDFATTVVPEKAMELFAEQGIKCVPTGLAHGTITVVLDHVGYEITTLRQDVETDGRHAKIAYTQEWRQDAARRDFTFNALYVDKDGILYDFFAGVNDAEKGYVRFIGDAHARICEDVLRILRFFRFYAYVGRGEPDAEALLACRDLAHLIPRLSSERIMRETIKLLAAPDPLAACRLMCSEGVMKEFLPEAKDVVRLQALHEAEVLHRQPPSALTRLAALISCDPSVATTVAVRLKFSHHDAETIHSLLKAVSALEPSVSPLPLRHILYLYGVEHTKAALLLKGNDLSHSLAILQSWERPCFPIKGEDIVKGGIPAGPGVGDILRTVEAWWIAGDFRASRDACLDYARKAVLSFIVKTSKDDRKND